MISYKPYINVVEQTTNRTVSVMVKAGSLTMPANTTTLSNGVICIDCTVTNGNTNQNAEKTYQIADNKKVAVRIFDSSNNFKGQTIFKTGAGNYTNSPVKVHCHLRSQPVAGTTKYYRFVSGGANALAITPAITESSALHKITITLDLLGRSGTVDSNVSLNDYDLSVCNLIEVLVIDTGTEGGGTAITKGKGTTDEDDADTSGDGV